MAETKEFTLADVAQHNTKKDLYMVVHDKVYSCASFVDEHPGGEEVMLDVGGQDATDAFEDVGHSDEAREILAGLMVGDLKRGENDPPAKSSLQQSTASKSGSTDAGGLGVGVYALIVVGGALAYFAYQYLQGSSQGSKA
nr:putative cytochrome b5 [Quercus suber]